MEDIYDIAIGFAIFLLIIIFFWAIPIYYGIKWAKIKGVSKLWMLFGIHPMLGWIAYLVLRYGVDPRKQCVKCKEYIKMEALVCRYCGNQMNHEEIQLSMMEYQQRKRQ